MYEFDTETVGPETLDHTNGKITKWINFQQNTKIPFLSLATEEKPTCQGRGHEEE